MKKLFCTQRSFLKTCWNWLVNIKNLGFLGLIIALFSLIVGYWSFDATYKALEISAKTSFRDSITSIQMNSNRKNDSILTKYNNLRDSIQQQKTVELLEKYNELADKLLKAQIDAEKPSIAIVAVLFTDTVYKKLIPFDGHFYKMSINTFELLVMR